jgi:hypothetical protein
MPVPGSIVIVTDSIQDIDEWTRYISINGGDYELNGTYTCPFIDSGSGEEEVRTYSFAAPCTIPTDTSTEDIIKWRFDPAGYDSDLTEFSFESEEYEVTQQASVPILSSGISFSPCFVGII